MSFGKKVNTEFMAWVGVAMIVVVASLIFLNFKTSNVICPSGYEFNTSTANTCYQTANNSVTASASGNLGTTIDTFLTALSEPKNWVAIVIIAIVGIGILVYYNRNVKASSKGGRKKLNY